jgi:metal-dependent hydrolase (beta-lactamase superfamily II)
MKLTTLIGNHVDCPGLLAEQGMSVLVQAGQMNILFNTGYSTAYGLNARELGFRLEEADALVLSDRSLIGTEGFNLFLKENNQAKIYLTAASRKKGQAPLYENIARESHTARFQVIQERYSLNKDVIIVPVFPSAPGADPGGSDPAELSLIIKAGNTNSILCACGRRDIKEIIQQVKDIDHLPLNLLLGGINIYPDSAHNYTEVVNFLNNSGVKALGVGNKMKLEIFSDLMMECRSRVFYNSSGTIINLP